jgi:hypothetical protein
VKSELHGNEEGKLRKTVLIGLAVMAVLAVAAPVGLASAASHRVSLHYTLDARASTPPGDPGRFSGKPFGSGRLVSLETPGNGNYDLTFHTKGGIVKIAITGAPQGTKIVGTWKTIGGTGSYKHIKGHGKLVGQELLFTLTGTVTY